MKRSEWSSNLQSSRLRIVSNKKNNFIRCLKKSLNSFEMRRFRHISMIDLQDSITNTKIRSRSRPMWKNLVVIHNRNSNILSSQIFNWPSRRTHRVDPCQTAHTLDRFHRRYSNPSVHFLSPRVLPEGEFFLLEQFDPHDDSLRSYGRCWVSLFHREVSLGREAIPLDCLHSWSSPRLDRDWSHLSRVH